VFWCFGVLVFWLAFGLGEWFAGRRTLDFYCRGVTASHPDSKINVAVGETPTTKKRRSRDILKCSIFNESLFQTAKVLSGIISGVCGETTLLDILVSDLQVFLETFSI
jgi:hypothetical protein